MDLDIKSLALAVKTIAEEKNLPEEVVQEMKSKLEEIKEKGGRLSPRLRRKRAGSSSYDEPEQW